MPGRCGRKVWPIAIAALLSSAGASAEEGAAPEPRACTDAPEVCGREAFARGVTAYQASDWDTAVLRFTEALHYKWHPAIALNLALAEAEAGHSLEGIRNLDAILQDPAVAGPALVEQATRERERMRGTLASIELDAGTGAASRLRVDGNLVEGRRALEVDPGPHELEIVLPSGATIRRAVELQPRERLHLSVDRTQELVVLPERERGAARKTPSSSPQSAPSGVPPIWFYLSAGATAVLGGVTIWSALDTRAAYKAYERALPTASQVDVDRRVDAGHSLETRTNVLLAATGVASLGTAVLGVFFVKWNRSPAASGVVAGPGSVAFRGSF